MKLPGAFPYPVTPNSRARVSTEDTKARKSSEKSPAKKTNQKIVKEDDKPVFAMLEMKNTKVCTCRPPETRLCISCYMRHVFRQSTSGRRDMAPKALAKNLKYISKGFSLGRQEDAHEFLTMMRDLLKRRHAEDSMDESLIKRVFCSLVLMRVTCCECKSWTDNTEELYDMQLAIQNTDDLFGAIQHYTMEKVDGRTCKDCGKENSLLKTMFLKFPSIATFQLKRFGMDNKETKKIEKPVSFPLELDLLSFAADTVAQDEEKKYTLYGVIVHEGSTLESGHYYCFVQISPGLWFRFNDEWVSRVDEYEVLSEQAYIVFYAERGTGWFTDSIIAQETPERSIRGICFQEGFYLLLQDPFVCWKSEIPFVTAKDYHCKVLQTEIKGNIPFRWFWYLNSFNHCMRPFRCFLSYNGICEPSSSSPRLCGARNWMVFYAERGTGWFTDSIIAQETPESNQRETALKSNIAQQPKDSTSPPAVIETIQVPEPPKSKQTDPATKGKTPPGSKSLGSGGRRTTKTRTSEVKQTDKMKIITPHAAKSSETAKGKATHSAKSQNTDPKVRIWR
ncbi:hypothetical protein OROHE_014731 [Orobanche hederae]